MAATASKAYKIAFKLEAMMGKRYGKTFAQAENIAQRFGNTLTSLGKGMTLAVTAPLKAVGIASVMAAKQWESSWVSVRKVTSAAEEDLQALEATARQMARELPHTHDAIASVFEAGSRLGIATDYLEGFSRTMLAVESVTTLTLDKAASGFAAIANVMGTSHGDFDRMGSTVLKLGNNFNTAEADILNMSSRLAGSASVIGMTESQLMALSTATGAVGISAEVGATAFNTLMRDMQIAVASGGGNLQKFADIAGKSAGDFQRVFQNDAMGAITAFIGGLGRVEDSGGSVAVTLSEMGYNADGIYRTLMNLSGGYDVLIEALEMGNAAWAENTELTKAVEERYATLEARMQVMRNQMRDAGITIGQALMPFVEKLVGGITHLVDRFSNLDEGTQRTIIRLGMVAAAAGPVLMIGGKIAKTVGKAQAAYGKFRDTLQAVTKATEIANAAQTANAKLTKINTAVKATAGKASAARKEATLAESKALKLAAQAEIARATSGATNTKAMAAATKAEQARIAATKAGKIANKHAAALDKIRTNQIAVSTAATAANAKAQEAQVLAKTKLGKVMALTSKLWAGYTVKVTGASASLKAHAVSMKAAAAGKGLLSKGLLVATAGVIKFTAALLANPIGAIIAGVVALGLVIAGLVKWLNRVSAEYKAMQEEAEQLLERQRALSESAENAALQFAEQSQAMENSQLRIAHLAESVEYLSSRYDLTSAEMARLDSYIAELNSSVPGLTLAYNAQTGALNMTTDALSSYLAKAAMEAQIIAQREESARLWGTELDLAAAYAETAQRRYEMEAKLNDGSRRRRADRRALEGAINDLIAAEEGYRAALEANATRYAEVNRLIDDNVQALEDKRRAQMDAEIALHGYEMAMRRQMFTAEEWATAQNEALSKMNAAFENYQRTATNAFDQVNQRATISLYDMIGNMNANAYAVEKWSTNLAILTEKGLEAGLIEQLRQAGPATADQVALIVSELEEVPNRLYELNEAYANSTLVAMEAMQREFDPEGVAQSAEELIDHVALAILENTSMEYALVEKINASFAAFSESIDAAGFDTGGYNMAIGAAQGITSGTIHVERAMTGMANAGMRAFENAMAMSSPSKRMGQAGEYTVDGYVLQIYAMIGEVEKACSDMADAVEKSLYVDLPPIVAPTIIPYTYSVPTVPDPIGIDTGGYRNAFGSEFGFNRFDNLRFDDSGSGSPFQTARPIDSMNRMSAADSYQSNTYDFHYTNSIQIDGSGHSMDELRDMVEQAVSSGQRGFKDAVTRVIEDREKTRRRLANV